MWFSLTFPWLFQSVQNSLTFPWLENAFPFFQVFQVFQSEWEPWYLTLWHGRAEPPFPAVTSVSGTSLPLPPSSRQSCCVLFRTHSHLKENLPAPFPRPLCCHQPHPRRTDYRSCRADRASRSNGTPTQSRWWRQWRYMGRRQSGRRALQG